MRATRLTYANVTSTLALVIAMSGGAAYAANTIRSTDIVDGEVKTNDLASNAVTTAKVRNESLTAPDIAPSGVGASELATDSVGVDEIQVTALPAFTYQSTASSASDTTVTKEVVATCGRTSSSVVTGGGFVISPNISAIVHRSYAVSSKAWLVRVTTLNQGTAWSLTVVANCLQ